MANAATTAPVPNLPGTRSSSGLKYYPEGGWGWIVVISVFITQVITLGLHLSFGVTFYVFQIVNYADRNLTGKVVFLSFRSFSDIISFFEIIVDEKILT